MKKTSFLTVLAAVILFSAPAMAASTNSTKIIKTVTANYTILSTDSVVEIEKGGPVILTLPAASAVATTSPITIKHLDTKKVAADMGTYKTVFHTKVVPDGSDTIDGASVYWFGGYTVLYSDGVSAWRSSEYLDGLTFAPSATTLTVSGASTLTGAVTAAADVTVSADSTGGNAGAKNEFIGLPRVKLVSLGTGTNPGTDTKALMDDSSAGEFAPVDASVTEAEGSVAGIFRVGASSYAATFLSSAVEDDGFIDAGLGGAGSWEDLESVGMWIYSTVALTAADLQLVLTDDGGARKFNFPAVATANKWTWIEINISSLDAGTGDNISDVAVTLTGTGATNLGAFTVYVDGGYAWDAVDEEALGVAAQTDGILSVMSVVTAAGQANTQTMLTEYTDYFVHYESGNDFVVWITDQSANSNVCLVAY